MKKILKHFEKSDPVMFELIRKLGLVEFSASKTYFYNLCRSIVGQQLSTKSAFAIFGRFKKLFPKEEILPEKLLKLPGVKLREVGLSGTKASYLKDLAAKVLNGEVKFEGIENTKDEEVIEMLTKVHGIGVWTAEMFLMGSLGREDIFSHGDLGLKNAIKKVYGLENPTRVEVETIVKKWSPYKTYASRILWKSLDNSPV